ncbi:tRNA (mo5U34)-methyltransferase [Candidatus Photodesmus katoptron]|uniref:tRNA U34 carboxymethyltransferase n=1 Tax=Candidatus Photodesmus katoptron Akat1 TaxID=1236703 RepID=S3DJT9_9GAMM|nr:tRNA 5-methoxyuridine(34)/uridine 5-oxyacetic acid(34) synthase CmoB [Candidatus Photodesmus katoptron]EPE37419.1 hypothetical protein O1U_0721 [Candidatus Photodesmus katoptron Akat1]KEY90829.1 tRNA (mo5U34)-methyltransferase [Candidatus Photodesmus katoptron]
MINFSSFYEVISQTTSLQPWLNTLPKQLTYWINAKNSNFNHWIKILNKIPDTIPDNIDLKYSVSISNNHMINAGRLKQIEQLLKSLSPWRKGPYSIYDIYIDSEWHSDWKWNRLLPHISNLKNRVILDVGCGNGYHLWRTVGEDTQLSIGIDPSRLCFIQFEAIRKLLGNDQRTHLLPLGIEQLPKLKAFDTVFSMGVLYHRRSPIDHLIQLKDQLRSKGELVLETLVIEGDQNTVLFPVDRYAQMRNIYFIPSASVLKIWLRKTGFKNIRIVNTQTTNINEQRQTKWMMHNSLCNYLDTKDSSKTIEGYPAPKRTILIANKP